ncbi:MAG: diguanylate cyclase [Calditrichia bacterium]|nr:diguanylate cyclase [Calditrichia bacterium]
MFQKKKYPISILFIDIDFFHVFNETYEYVAGNSLLRKLAALINENL